MSAISDDDASSSGIPNAHLLTFVDKMKGQFHNLVDRNSMSGEVTYPRREYLTNVAFQRKQEADEAAKKAQGR